MSNYEFPEVEMGAMYMGNEIEYLIIPICYSSTVGKYNDCLIVFEYIQNPDFGGSLWEKKYYGHATEEDFHKNFHYAISKEKMELPPDKSED